MSGTKQSACGTSLYDKLCKVYMGRIKTTFVKRRTKELIKSHGDKFSSDFTENKKTTDQYAQIQSKKLRNILAGYMTRLKKKQQ